MDPKLFISYRHADAAAWATSVKERLAQEFGKDSVFFDVGGSIPPGADFANIIGDKLANCAALLAIIGPKWLDTRLKSPKDLVRVEIGAALKRNIHVFPILVDNAEVPEDWQLPDDLNKLSRLNGLKIAHKSFERDMTELVRALAAAGVRKKTSPGWSELLSGVLNAVVEERKQRPGSSSAPETPAGSSLARVVPGLWELQIMYPNGAVGRATAVFESSGNFRAEGRGLTTFTIDGVWRADSSNQVSLRGHQFDGRQTLPYHTVVGFSDIGDNAMVGSLNTGERTVWQRRR
jgi:hypothetical protein